LRGKERDRADAASFCRKNFYRLWSVNLKIYHHGAPRLWYNIAKISEKGAIIG
jgi:hypothetical protein